VSDSWFPIVTLTLATAALLVASVLTHIRIGRLEAKHAVLEGRHWRLFLFVVDYVPAPRAVGQQAGGPADQKFANDLGVLLDDEKKALGPDG
jgi:hypothetical protein